MRFGKVSDRRRQRSARSLTAAEESARASVGDLAQHATPLGKVSDRRRPTAGASVGDLAQQKAPNKRT